MHWEQNSCQSWGQQPVQHLARQAEGKNPANVVLIRGAGEMGVYETFEEKHELSGSVVASAALIAGIGSSVGLERIPVLPSTPLEEQVQIVLNEFERKDFVLFNIKNADATTYYLKAVLAARMENKSEIAPKGIEFKINDFVISDKYCTILTVNFSSNYNANMI